MRLLTSIFIISALHPFPVTAIPDALPTPTLRPRIEFTAVSPVSPAGNLLLFKRQQQGNCQANHISCASQSAPDACCPNGTTCTHDSAGTIACCPNNYVCTGTVGGGGGAGSATSMSSGSSITSAPISGSGITVGSTLSNPYYPFPIIATTYSNSGACLSAFTFCQQQSSSCYAALAGQNGVTVSNGLGGGGVTQAGASGLPQASASGICSSLSMTACYGLQSSVCAQFGAGGGTGSASRGHGPRETGHACMRYLAAVGMVGAVGLAV